MLCQLVVSVEIVLPVHGVVLLWVVFLLSCGWGWVDAGVWLWVGFVPLYNSIIRSGCDRKSASGIVCKENDSSESKFDKVRIVVFVRYVFVIWRQVI